MTAPLKYAGSSANLASYSDQKSDGLSVSVLESALVKDEDGHWRVRRPSVYYVTVYRRGEGELGDFVHRPRRGSGRLSPATITRLVRAWLAEKEDA
jgi:hypothetical protein